MRKVSNRKSRRKSSKMMSWKLYLAIAAIFALTLGFYGCSNDSPLEYVDQGQQTQQADDGVISGQYIVVMNTTRSIGNAGPAMKINKQQIREVASRVGVKAERVYSTVLHGFSGKLTDAQYKALLNDPAVDYIEPDHTISMYAQTVPWGISHINAPVAHARGTKGSGVKVGIIDTGIDYGHPDLAANYAGGIDYVNGDNDPMDDAGHGTHVSGTVAAIDNNIGVLGVAPSVQLYGIKVLDQNGSGTFSNVIAGIDWAAANGMNVVNLSLGASVGTAALQTACDNAYASGVVICAAAGNDYGGPVGYPAKYSSTIAVSSITQSNTLSVFSNKGPEVELTAPGTNILSTYKGGQYAYMDGTSMATPHVAGVAALVWSAGQFTTASAVRNQMNTTATDIGANGRDNNFGYGIVDADASTAGGGGGTNQAPTANANGPYTGTVGNAVSFSSAGSSDPDGTITGYSWDFGDGGTSTTANPSYTYNNAGTYTATLTVTDDQGATGSNSTTASITAPNNNPPVADFSGNPTSGTVPLTVSFSDLSTNSPTSWSWDFGDGGTSTAQNPSHTYNAIGTYTVTMTATNANGSNTMTKNGYITVNDVPPAGEGFILSRNPDFSTDDRAFTSNETMYMKVWTNVVDFNDMKKERWEMKNANGDRIRQNFTNNFDGTWTASFALSGLPTNDVDWTWKGQVEDNPGNRYQPTTNVTVTQGGGGNQAPTANANGPYTGTVGNAVSFSSAGSSDPDGTIVGYSWDFGDGGTSTQANPSYTYGAAGAYTVTLTVTDDQGATGSNSTTADITSGGGGNQAPTANANGPYSGTAGNAVSFSSAGSSDPDGTIVGYSWDFGDGGTSTQANPSYTYGAASTYTVTLTVTDDQGATGSNSTTATITSGGGGGGDVVTITRAEWKADKSELKVRATSDNTNATLTVVGYGVMTYKADKGYWELKKKPVNPAPSTVTVTSDFGGSDTSNVTMK